MAGGRRILELLDEAAVGCPAGELMAVGEL
jgi:hypothetical protein